MKNYFTFAFLLLTLQMYAQGFTISPYQDFSLSSPIVADFTGDGKLDVLGAQYGASIMVLQVNNGTTPLTFSEKDINVTLGVYSQPTAADMEGDTDMDFVIARGPNLVLFILENDGDGNFTEQPLGVSGATILKAADIDHDNDMDIVGIHADNNSLMLFLNDGNQNFSIQNIFTNSTENLELFDIGDMDNDDDLDIVLGFRTFSGNQIVLYKNNGSNNYEKVVVVANGFSNIEGLLIADINGDAKNDIVAIRGFDCEAFVNQGNLSFQRKALVSTNNPVRSVQTGDYNGEGRRDIVLGTNSGDITWYKNLSNTSLTFQSQTVGSVSPCYSIANGDLDNDNDVDLVVSNGEFWWYENGITQEQSSTLTFSDKQVTVFPNPFQDKIQVKNIGQDDYLLQLTDTNGKVVYSAKITSEVTDLSKLSPGIYFLSLTNTATQQVRSATIYKAE